MYGVMGLTGQVGGAVARTLLAAGKQVRGIVRDTAKAQRWIDRGCELVVAETSDVAALTQAFQGAEAVYVMMPPMFDPSEGFPEVRALSQSVADALRVAAPKHVVALSTVGAQVSRFNLLEQLHEFEKTLRPLPMPVSFVRSAWFLENTSWDVAPARGTGVVPSYLQPLDRAIPMVSAEDVGITAASLMLEGPSAPSIVELEGPATISPNDIAVALSEALGKPVQMQVVPHDTWEQQFLAAGMKNPAPRIAMLDGFNEGWITFEGGSAQHRKGNTTLQQVVQKLVNANAD
jgi:uncharacterized protein YbjT (DUF2867 family)